MQEKLTYPQLFKRIKAGIRANDLDVSFDLLEQIQELYPTDEIETTIALLWQRYERLKRDEYILDTSSNAERTKLCSDLLAFLRDVKDNTFQGKAYKFSALEVAKDQSFTNITCPVCRSSEIDINDNNAINCRNCGASEEYFVPSPIQPVKGGKMPEADSRQIEKLMLLCRREIIVKNYGEALQLCDQALAIGFDLQEVWEYRALCYYYHTPKTKIIQSNAKQILADLKISNHPIVVKYQNSKAIREIIARGLSAAVDRQYAKLPQGDERQRDYLILLMRVWQSCYLIYPADIFLKRALHELVGRGRLLWFELDWSQPNHYKLFQNHQGALKARFNSPKMLNNILTALHLQGTEEERQQQLNKYHEIIALELAKAQSIQTYNDYTQYLTNNTAQNNYWRSDMPEDFLPVIRYVEEWERVYHINNNIVGIQLAIRELACKSRFCWYDVDNDGNILEKPFINQLGFAPLARLERLVGILADAETTNFEDLKDFNLLQQHIRNHISNGIATDTAKRVRKLHTYYDGLDQEFLEEVEGICSEYYRAYQASQNAIYLERALDILIKEAYRTIFYRLEGSEVQDSHNESFAEFSALIWLKNLCEEMPDDDWSFDTLTKDIRKTLVQHRFDIQKDIYKKILGRFNEFSVLETDELKNIITVAKTCLQLHQIEPRLEYLDWAIQELNGKSATKTIWVFLDKNSTVTTNKRVFRMTKTEVAPLWEEIVQEVLQHHIDYDVPTLRTVSDNSFLNRMIQPLLQRFKK